PGGRGDGGEPLDGPGAARPGPCEWIDAGPASRRRRGAVLAGRGRLAGPGEVRTRGGEGDSVRLSIGAAKGPGCADRRHAVDPIPRSRRDSIDRGRRTVSRATRGGSRRSAGAVDHVRWRGGLGRPRYVLRRRGRLRDALPLAMGGPRGGGFRHRLPGGGGGWQGGGGG